MPHCCFARACTTLGCALCAKCAHFVQNSALIKSMALCATWITLISIRWAGRYNIRLKGRSAQGIRLKNKSAGAVCFTRSNCTVPFGPLSITVCHSEWETLLWMCEWHFHWYDRYTCDACFTEKTVYKYKAKVGPLINFLTVWTNIFSDFAVLIPLYADCAWTRSNAQRTSFVDVRQSRLPDSRHLTVSTASDLRIYSSNSWIMYSFCTVLFILTTSPTSLYNIHKLAVGVFGCNPININEQMHIFDNINGHGHRIFVQKWVKVEM